MTGRGPPWPVAVVTGMLGSGKTTMIGRMLRGRMLRHGATDDTLVLVNEFGEIGLDHALIKAVTDNVVLLPNGCLCCTIRNDIVQTLREIRSAWLAGTIPDFGRVVIETTGLAEPAPLIASLLSHPVLAEMVSLRTIATVVDASFGPRQIAGNATCRNQIAVADHLLVSKGDVAGGDAVAALSTELKHLNPMATIGTSGAVTPDLLFRSESSRFDRPLILCDEPSDHLADVSTIVLRPSHTLEWTRFKVWLATVLDAFGLDLLRLKGRLRFGGSSASLIIQAVHHTFYPVVAEPERAADGQPEFLVLMFAGGAPLGLGDLLAEGGFVVDRPAAPSSGTSLLARDG